MKLVTLSTLLIFNLLVGCISNPFNSIENVKEETYEMPEVLDFEIKNALSNALSKLTPREERVIRERFFHGKSLEEVGQQFSVTRESIRRNEARAQH